MVGKPTGEIVPTERRFHLAVPVLTDLIKAPLLIVRVLAIVCELPSANCTVPLQVTLLKLLFPDTVEPLLKMTAPVPWLKVPVLTQVPPVRFVV